MPRASREEDSGFLPLGHGTVLPRRASAVIVQFKRIAPRGAARGLLATFPGSNVAHGHPEVRHVSASIKGRRNRRSRSDSFVALSCFLCGQVCAVNGPLFSRQTLGMKCYRGNGRDEVDLCQRWGFLGPRLMHSQLGQLPASAIDAVGARLPTQSKHDGALWYA